MELREMLEMIDDTKFVTDPFKKKTGKRTKKRIDEYFNQETRQFILDIINDDYEEVNIRSVNDAANLITARLSPMGFKEIGIGSNRIAYLKDGYVFKIAMDRRGCIDNMSEYLRSIEEPQYLAKVYETNRMIAVAEYARLLSFNEFQENKDKIRKMLAHLSLRYITQDMGLINKNYCNLGFRSNGDLIFIDYAYMYKKAGREDKICCSVCGHSLRPNAECTGYVCTNDRCGTTYLTYEVLNMMDVYLDEIDDEEVVKVANSGDTDSSNFTFVKISGSNVGEMTSISEEEAKELQKTIEERNEKETKYLSEQQKSLSESSIDDLEIDDEEEKQEEAPVELHYRKNDISVLSEGDKEKIKELYLKTQGGTKS